MIKTCIKCGEVKSIEHFRKYKTKKGSICHRNDCTECEKLRSKNYYHTNTDSCKEAVKRYIEKNRDIVRAKKKIYDEQYQEKNREKRRKQCIEYNQKNKQRVCEYYKNRRQTKEYKEKSSEYFKHRRRNDPNFRITALLRGRVRDTIDRNSKTSPTLSLLGCTVEYLKIHLQLSALNNGYFEFDINNYSGRDFHIDHIVPCSFFDLTNEFEQQLCFHYSNLQILSSEHNLSKSNKLLI